MRRGCAAHAPAIDALAASLPAAVPPLSAEHVSAYLWGTYRPHLYFGVRTRCATDALLGGLAWFDADNGLPLRHVAQQHDGVRFHWVHHNGRDYGRQVIEDTRLGLQLTVSFWKRTGEQGVTFRDLAGP